MCLASWAIELATNSEATRARMTARTVAPPPKAMPMGMENAVAMAGAMKVIDWNSTPLKPTAPPRSFAGGCSPALGAGPVWAGTSPDAIAAPHRARCSYRPRQIVCFGHTAVEEVDAVHARRHGIPLAWAIHRPPDRGAASRCRRGFRRQFCRHHEGCGPGSVCGARTPTGAGHGWHAGKKWQAGLPGQGTVHGPGSS